jgi:hypothetical protein
MTIYFIDGQPHISTPYAFIPIDAQTYYMMIEQGEISHTEVVDYD